MSQETLKRLIGALIVAVVAWGVVSIASGSGRSSGASGALEGVVDAMRDTAALERVSFSTDGSDPIELVRGAGGWTVDGLVADSGQVVRLVDGLASATLGDVAARNASNHGRMGVDAEHAARVELTVGGRSYTVLAGDQGPAFGSTYVRMPDEDEVHTVGVDLRQAARRSLEEWRSKRVLAVDTAAVARLDLTREGTSYTVVRADSTWTFADGSPADDALVKGVLGELRDLRADGFMAEGDSLAATPMGGRVEAFDAAGTSLATLEVGSGTGDRWGRTPTSADVYRFASYRMDRLFPTRARVVPEGG